jgi:hypothetical protein
MIFLMPCLLYIVTAGTCIPGAKKLVCNCPPLFTGRRCEVDLCSCTTCQQADDADCKCPAQRPAECKILCPLGQCQNGGTCIVVQGQSHCKCVDMIYFPNFVHCVVQQNPLMTFLLRKLICWSQSNLLPKFSHTFNTHIALLIHFLLEKCEHFMIQLIFHTIDMFSHQNLIISILSTSSQHTTTK